MKPNNNLRKDFHDFSLFMARAVESGDNTYADIEGAIYKFFLSHFHSKLDEVVKRIEGKERIFEIHGNKQINKGLRLALSILEEIKKDM